MGFYDSVKDDVRDEHRPDDETTESDDAEEREMPFDQLKKDAEEYDDESEQEQEDESGGGSDIEVLTPDGAEPAEGQAAASASEPAQQTQEPRPAETGGDGSARPQQEQTSSTADTSTTQQPAAADGSADDSEVLAALERIEAQNDEMIDLLRGIKRSLDR